jgi:hypothetical protein
MYNTFEVNMNMYAYQHKTQNTHKLILCELGNRWVYFFVFVLFVYVWFVCLFVCLFVLFSLRILFCFCFCLCFCFAFMKLYYINIKSLSVRTACSHLKTIYIEGNNRLALYRVISVCRNGVCYRPDGRLS